jgi:hypothetical protein
MGEVDKVDKSAMSQAATVHVNSVDHDRLLQQVHAAASAARDCGDTGVADYLLKLEETLDAKPQTLKDQLIPYVTDHPDVLEYFPPEFAIGIQEQL